MKEEEELLVHVGKKKICIIVPVKDVRHCEFSLLCETAATHCLEDYTGTRFICAFHVKQWKDVKHTYLSPFTCLNMTALSRKLLSSLKKQQIGQMPSLFFRIGYHLSHYFTFGLKNSIMYSPLGRNVYANTGNAQINTLLRVHHMLVFHRNVCDYARQVVLLFVKHATHYCCKDVRLIIGRLVWGMRSEWAKTLCELCPNPRNWQ